MVSGSARAEEPMSESPDMGHPVLRVQQACGFEAVVQLDGQAGYALAAAWLWDALQGDPAVPVDVTQNLAADLVVFAKALMKVAPEYDIDLCIRDGELASVR